MKLSILIYNDKPSKLDSLLDRVFEDYNARDTEVVVLDNGSTNIDSTIANYASKIGEGSLKVIFTNKKKRMSAYWSAIRAVEGEYSIFLTSSSTIKKGFIEKILITIETINPDIIEMDISFKGTVNLKYSAPEELVRNLTYDVKNSYLIAGYISPFMANKAVKTDFVRHLTTLEGLQETEFIIIYTMLFHAETYIYINNPGLQIVLSDKVNQSDRIRQWDYILKYYKRYSEWEKIKDSIEYAYVRYMALFTPSIISKERTSKQDKKWDIVVVDRITREFPEWKHNRLIKEDQRLQRTTLLKQAISSPTSEGTIKIEQKNIKPSKKTTIHVARALKKSITATKKAIKK